MHDFQRVLEDVLPVARSLPQLADHLDELLVELAAPPRSRLLARLTH